MADTVKTWRVTTESLKVGNSLRLFGEFIPEAADWPGPTQAAYERAKRIEKTYVDKEELDAALKEYLEREVKLQSEAEEEDVAKKKEVKKPKSKKRVVKRKDKSNAGTDGQRESGREAAEDGRGTEGSEVLEEVSV
jgi:hypothetical protein